MFIDPPSFTPTNVIPLVNEACSASFSRIDKNKKTILKRGWTCSGDTIIISDLTKHDPKIISDKIMSINYSSGNSAVELDTLVAVQDLYEAREINNKKQSKVWTGGCH